MTTLIIAGAIVLVVVGFVIYLMQSSKKAGQDEQRAAQGQRLSDANRARLDAEHDAANATIDSMRDRITGRH